MVWNFSVISRRLPVFCTTYPGPSTPLELDEANVPLHLKENKSL